MRQQTTALPIPAPDLASNQNVTEWKETQAPTPILHPAPALPPAPPTGPLTLNEQYVAIDRDHRLSPSEKQRALDALTARMVDPSPQDRAQDQAIRNSRTQPDKNQYFTESEQTPSLAECQSCHAHAA